MATESAGDGTRHYSEAELRPIALAIVAGLVFSGTAVGTAFPTLPLLGEVLGLGAVMVGLIIAMDRLTRIPLNAPAGTLIDTYGPRTPIVLGLFVQALAPIGYVLGMHTPTAVVGTVPVVGEVTAAGLVFLGARVLLGIGGAFVLIGAFAMMATVTGPHNRGRWFGYMQTGQGAGFPIGLFLGGRLAEAFGPSVAFTVAGGLAILAGAIAIAVLPAVNPSGGERTGLRDFVTVVRRDPRIVPLGIGHLTIRFVFRGVMLSTVAIYIGVHNIGEGAAVGTAGAVLGVGVVFYGVGMIANGQFSDRVSHRLVVAVPPFLSLVAGLALLATVPPLELVLLASILLGLGCGGLDPVLLAMVGDIASGEELGRMGGAYNIMGDLGAFTGPVVAVPMTVDWLGFTETYLLCALGVLVAAMVVTGPLVVSRVSSRPRPG